MATSGDVQAELLLSRAIYGAHLHELCSRFCREVGAAESAYHAAVSASVDSLLAALDAFPAATASAPATPPPPPAPPPPDGRAAALAAVARAVGAAAAPTLPPAASDALSALLRASQEQCARCASHRELRQREVADAAARHAHRRAAYLDTSARAERALREGAPPAADPWLKEVALHAAAQAAHEARRAWTEAGGALWREAEPAEAAQTAALRRLLLEWLAALEAARRGAAEAAAGARGVVARVDPALEWTEFGRASCAALERVAAEEPPGGRANMAQVEKMGLLYRREASLLGAATWTAQTAVVTRCGFLHLFDPQLSDAVPQRSVQLCGCSVTSDAKHAECTIAAPPRGLLGIASRLVLRGSPERAGEGELLPWLAVLKRHTSISAPLGAANEGAQGSGGQGVEEAADYETHKLAGRGADQAALQDEHEASPEVASEAGMKAEQEERQVAAATDHEASQEVAFEAGKKEVQEDGEAAEKVEQEADREAGQKADQEKCLGTHQEAPHEAGQECSRSVASN